MSRHLPSAALHEEQTVTDSTSDIPQIRLGIIGTGLAVEKLHWPALRQLTDQFRVTAFTNRSRPNAERFANYSGTAMDAFVVDYQDLLGRDDVDAVLISLPIPLNLPVTQAALEAGKHVICEKPAGANAEEGRAFVELADRYPNLTVLIAENMFYIDDLRVARSLLDDGTIGQVHLATWQQVSQLVPRDGQFSSTPWRHDPGYAGGPHLDAGVHHTATIRLLLGDAVRVSAETQDANSTHGGPSDLTMSLRFVSGAIGSYTAAYPELPVPAGPGELRLYGTEAVITTGRDGTKVHRPDGSVEVWTVDGSDGGYYNEFLNFHEAIAGQAPVAGTVAQSWRNMELILSGLESAERGVVIEIPAWPTALSATAVPLWRPAGQDDLLGGLPGRLNRSTEQAS
jgi:predicted dehydrogenase